MSLLGGNGGSTIGRGDSNLSGISHFTTSNSVAMLRTDGRG